MTQASLFFKKYEVQITMWEFQTVVEHWRLKISLQTISQDIQDHRWESFSNKEAVLIIQGIQEDERVLKECNWEVKAKDKATFKVVVEVLMLQSVS